MESSYRTLINEVEQTVVRKKSKFICTIKSVASEEEAINFIQKVKKHYNDARHNCFAYIIGMDNPIIRCSDDGEPSGTAGKPILEVLKGTGMKNIVAVVTRYFGGVLLGTGGLIKAYTDSTKESLTSAKIIEKILCEKVIVTIEYGVHSKVEYELHNNNQIIYDINYSDKVTMTLLLEKLISNKIKNRIVEITNAQCDINTEDDYYTALIDGKRILEKTILKQKD